MTAYRDLAYVEEGHVRQKLDLYVPDKGERLPLIIWVHGGAFLAGDKAGHIPAEYLKDGYAVASLNYRLSQDALFPAQVEDVKAAVRWLRAHAGTYRLDPDRFAAWGSSAGGYLVAMLGTTGDDDTFDTGQYLGVPSSVRAVVDYYGPTDFLMMDTQRLPNGMRHDPARSPESKLLGGPIQENKDLARQANPITYISDQDPPFLVIHGDRDPLVPFGQSVMLRDALEQAGVSVTLYPVEGAGHGRFTDPQVHELTRTFLNQHLKAVE